MTSNKITKTCHSTCAQAGVVHDPVGDCAGQGGEFLHAVLGAGCHGSIQAGGAVVPVVVDDLGAGIFTGADAVESGLADRTGDFDDAHELAAELAGIDGSYDVRAVSADLGFLGLLLGRDDETPQADLSGLCSSTPMAHAYFGDLGAYCQLD